MRRRVILWCLLVGVIMAASPRPVLSQGRAATTRVITSANNSVVVSVPRDEEFYFGTDRITQAEVPDRLKAAFKGRSPEGRMVYVKAGLHVSYKTAVLVTDTIKGAGFG